MLGSSEVGADDLSLELSNRNLDQPYKFNVNRVTNDWSKISLKMAQRMMQTGLPQPYVPSTVMQKKQRRRRSQPFVASSIAVAVLDIDKDRAMIRQFLVRNWFRITKGLTIEHCAVAGNDSGSVICLNHVTGYNDVVQQPASTLEVFAAFQLRNQGAESRDFRRERASEYRYFLCSVYTSLHSHRVEIAKHDHVRIQAPLVQVGKEGVEPVARAFSMREIS